MHFHCLRHISFALFILCTPFLVRAENSFSLVNIVSNSPIALVPQPYKEPRIDTAISLQGPATISPGTLIIYTATITNHGPEDSNSQGTYNNPPAAFAFDAANSDSRCKGESNSFPPGFSCYFGGLAADQTTSAKIAFVVSPHLLCDITVKYETTLTTSAGDTDLSNNKSTATSTVACPSSSSQESPVLDMQSVDFSPVNEVGDFDVLSIRICNEGKSDYVVRERGSIILHIVTIMGIYADVAPTGADYDLKAGECRSFTINNIRGETTPLYYLKKLPKGEYELEFNLLNTPALHSRITKKMHIGDTTFSFVPDTNDVASGSFLDVPSSHPNFDAITYLKMSDIVSGYSNGTFQPDTNITRAEFTKIVLLSALSKHDLRDTECFPFSTFGWTTVGHDRFPPDVKNDDWAAPYICAAIKQGIIKGYPDGTFKQTKLISFAEAAKILSMGFHGTPMPLPGTLGIHWFDIYVRDIERASAIPSSIQHLEQSITRGEMAEMVYRLKEHVTTKKSTSYAALAANSGIPVSQQTPDLPTGWAYQNVPDTPFEIPLPSNASFSKSQQGTSDVYLLPQKERTPQSMFAFYLSFQSCAKGGWCGPSGTSQNEMVLRKWTSEDGKVQINHFAAGYSFRKYFFSIQTTNNLYFSKLNIIGPEDSQSTADEKKADVAVAILRRIRLSNSK